MLVLNDIVSCALSIKPIWKLYKNGNPDYAASSLATTAGLYASISRTQAQQKLSKERLRLASVKLSNALILDTRFGNSRRRLTLTF